MSLLKKYTLREIVRTVIEEEDLPELPDFLESINLGDKLEVSSWQLVTSPWICKELRALQETTWAECSKEPSSTWG